MKLFSPNSFLVEYKRKKYVESKEKSASPRRAKINLTELEKEVP